MFDDYVSIYCEVERRPRYMGIRVRGRVRVRVRRLNVGLGLG